MGGGYLLISDSGATVGGQANGGALYVLRAATDAQPVRIVSEAPRKNGKFGHLNKVDVGSCGCVVAKDWDESVDGIGRAGALYILTQSASTAVRLISDTPRKNGRFGHGHSKVYTRNDVVIVTDPREEVDGQKNSGAVYMHSASIPRAKLVPQTARKNALFGVSIALSDSLIAVGDPRATVGDHKEAGQVYVYHTSDATVATTLTAPETQKKGRYGSSVAMSDTQLVVGAPTEQVGTQRAAGAAYLYATTSMEEPEAKLIAPTPAKNMRFGHRLELFGDSVAVSAPWETSAGIKAAGVVYVFVSRYSTVGNQTDTTTNSTNGINGTNGTAQTETPALTTSNSLEGTKAVMVKAEVTEAELMEAQFDEVGESDDDDESDDVSDVEDDYKEDGWFDVGESDDETSDELNGEGGVDLGESDDEGSDDEGSDDLDDYYDDDGSVNDSDDETSDDSLRQVGQTESSQEVHDLGASSDLLKLGESVDAEKKKEKKQKKKKQKEVKHKAKKAKQKAKKEARQKQKEVKHKAKKAKQKAK